MKIKSVYGFGINDIEEPITIDGMKPRYYTVWLDMIRRCYSEKHQMKKQTYIGCSVCKEWSSLTNFKQWFDENYIDGFTLDKDILVEGNKIYSPEYCRFVPVYLNSILVRSNGGNTLPFGISELKVTEKSNRINPTYTARCCDGHGKQLTKGFKTVEEAVSWHSITKKRIVKEQATRAFLENSIKTDIYLALVRREW